MASGPAGTGWSTLADTLNGIFGDKTKLRGFATDFTTNHGSDGHGAGGKTPYKFGQFVDRRGSLLKDTALAQFLIDSGRRHWDGPSLDLLEHTVRHSLTQSTPKGIEFNVTTDPNATVAKAVITNSSGQPLNTPAQISNTPAAGPSPDPNKVNPTYKVTINCPPSNLRPAP